LVKDYGDDYRKGKDLDEIWIVIIRIPFNEKARRGFEIHHAQTLADKDPSEANPRKVENKYLFKWEIPERFVLHQVSLYTYTYKARFAYGKVP
jgi:hypothetical protein